MSFIYGTLLIYSVRVHVLLLRILVAFTLLFMQISLDCISIAYCFFLKHREDVYAFSILLECKF